MAKELAVVWEMLSEEEKQFIEAVGWSEVKVIMLIDTLFSKLNLIAALFNIHRVSALSVQTFISSY